MRRPAWWWPALILVALNWWLGSSGTALAQPLDWAAHLLLYAALGFSLGRASGSYPAAWVLTAWLGALDQVHQAFVAGRDAGITGWWAALLGGFVGSRLSLTDPAESARSRRVGR
ncbi:VanZ family protein [Deinococcus irradiatisoli]|uniref:VanZ family protein n=1 Tax=Deinococcus irradiatisoli TaxID=2202254 RepID=UPI001FE75A3F|nr:VanZ family protein [Deinococcus irradiatisoli]